MFWFILLKSWDPETVLSMHCTRERKLIKHQYRELLIKKPGLKTMCNNEKALIIVISSQLNICKGCFISLKKSAVNQKHQQNNSTGFTYYTALLGGEGARMSHQMI